MLYFVTNLAARSQALAAVAAIDPKDKLVVEIKKYRSKRSTAQNALYWMWINLLSEHTGYTPNELHLSCRAMFLEIKAVEVFGRILHIPRSTTDLDTAEFSQYLNEIDRWATDEVDFILPHPDDLYYSAVVEEADGKQEAPA